MEKKGKSRIGNGYLTSGCDSVIWGIKGKVGAAPLKRKREKKKGLVHRRSLTWAERLKAGVEEAGSHIIGGSFEKKGKCQKSANVIQVRRGLPQGQANCGRPM